MNEPSLAFPDGYFIYLVKQVETGMRRPFEDLIAEHGISTAGYTALSVLQNRPGITSSELARRSFVRAQTMAETVSSLRRAGFVRREKDPTHGRQILLFTTEQGTARVMDIAGAVSGLEARILDHLDAAQRADLVRSLRAVRDALAEIARTARTST